MKVGLLDMENDSEDLAVFAAALSDLINTETEADIEELFVALNLSMSSNLDAASIKSMVKTHPRNFMEGEGTGRVPLSKCHYGVKDPDWPYYISVGYLHDLGALGESTAGRPSVIIPN